MAITHLGGTRLAPQKTRPPLNRKFMYAIGFVFLIAMHTYIPHTGGTGLDLSYNSVIWIFLSFAIAIGFYHIAIRKQMRYTKLTVTFFIACSLITLPVLYPGNDVHQALPALITLWAGWIFFFILQQFLLSNQHKQRLLWFIVLAVLLEASLGYLQFLGWIPASLFGYDDFTKIPFGIFPQASVMVSFLSTGLVISGYLLARQQTKYGQKVSRTLLLYLMPLFTAPLIIYLAQQLEWIGTAIGFLFVAIYLYRFSTPQRFSGWIASAVSGVGIGLILVSAGGSGVKAVADSAPQRDTLYPQAIDMLVEKPFTGYGYGRFESEYILYTARQHQLNEKYAAGIPATVHPHNEMLFWGIEGGIVPLTGIVIAAAMVLYKIFTARKGTRLAIFSLFIPITLHSQMGTPFLLSAIHWLTFIILLYWVDQRTSRYHSFYISRLSKIFIRSSSFAIPVFVTVYMACAIQAGYLLYKFDRSFPEDTAILSSAANPVSRKADFETRKESARLKSGLITGDAELLEEYVIWSRSAIQKVPRKENYTQLILAYLGLGEISKAEQIRSEAGFLFPYHDFSTLQIDPVISPVSDDLTESEELIEDIDKETVAEAAN